MHRRKELDTHGRAGVAQSQPKLLKMTCEGSVIRAQRPGWTMKYLLSLVNVRESVES